jgi:NADPH-dependent glutamate synthase beta subunit-like oxidoreductase
VITKEMQRIKEVIPQVNLRQPLGAKDIIQLKADFDFVIIATGAQKPRSLTIPGNERTIAALDFLKAAKTSKTKVGKNVVIIGAGNVGCDAAAEAHRLGARKIILLDIQEPASFGKEREAAEAVGAEFMWPVFTGEITPSGVKTGEEVPADTVIVSIGDVPDLESIPETVTTANGFVKINDNYQTSDPQIFAIGDVVKPGLLTEAIGSGRVVARTICDILEGKRPAFEKRSQKAGFRKALHDRPPAGDTGIF